MTQTNGTATTPRTDAAPPAALAALAALDEQARKHEIPAALLGDALDRLYRARALHATRLADALAETAVADQTPPEPMSEYEFLTGEKLPDDEATFHAAFGVEVATEGTPPIDEKHAAAAEAFAAFDEAGAIAEGAGKMVDDALDGFAAGDGSPPPSIDSADMDERREAIEQALAGTEPEEGDEDEADLPPHRPAATDEVPMPPAPGAPPETRRLMNCPLCLTEYIVEGDPDDGPFCQRCLADAHEQVTLAEGPSVVEPVPAGKDRKREKRHKKNR